MCPQHNARFQANLSESRIMVRPCSAVDAGKLSESLDTLTKPTRLTMRFHQGRKFFDRLLRSLLVIGGVTVGSLTHAANGNALPVYADLQYTYGGVRHSNINFNPGFGTLAVGAWIRPGIGIEGFIDQASTSSQEGNFDLTLEQATGVGLRFQSPTTDHGVFSYVVLGMVSVDITQDESDERGQRQVRQGFDGVRISLGFGYEFSGLDVLSLTGEYRHYAVDESIQIDGISFGLRWGIQ